MGETKCFQELQEGVREPPPPASKNVWDLAVSCFPRLHKDIDADAEFVAEASDSSNPERIPNVCEQSPVVGNQALARKVLEPSAIKNGWGLAVSQVKLGRMDGSELGSEASDTSDPEQIPEVCERQIRASEHPEALPPDLIEDLRQSPVVRNGWDQARRTVHDLGAGSADVTAQERILKLRSRMTIVSAFM